MRIDTREARPTDVAALHDLDETARTDPGRSGRILAAVASGVCIVAERGGSVVGYGVIEDSFFGQGFVSMLYVATAQRRHGVGGTLLQALARRCTTPKLFTSTNASNRPMQALLARSGFEPSGIVHNLDPGDPELVYVCFRDARRAHVPAEPATARLDRLADEGKASRSIRYERDPPLSNRDLGDLLQPDVTESEGRDYAPVLERSLLWICAYDGERLVGFCHLAWDGGVHAFLLDPTVREGYRRRGIGTALVREALAGAAAHAGLEWVHVDASAALMERFYVPVGFRPTPAGVVWLDDRRAGFRGSLRL